MTQEFPMLEKEHTTEKEWLEDIFYRSNSHSSQKNAIVAMRTFDIFCKEKLELPDPDSKFDGLCGQIAENIGTMNDAIDIEGITDEIIKNQEWFTANLDYKRTKNQKKCIDSFKTQ